ncbi:hypothetical protein EPIB1_1731 [Tritonibacter mobilis]|nr:hypothetical protein EPIB1_1731 [Tritonibacter mobilis]
MYAVRRADGSRRSRAKYQVCGLEVLRFAVQIAGGRGRAFGAAPPGPTLLGVALPHLKKGRELPGLSWH